MIQAWLVPLMLAASPEPLTQAQMVEALKLIDDRLSSTDHDYQTRFYIEERNPDKQAKVSQLVVYRRDKDHRLLLVFTKPKTQMGQGYLRLAQNLWFYDSSSGRWERRTARDNVVGAAIGADFDMWTLSQDYNPAYKGVEKLGSFSTHRLHLEAKPNADTPFPLTTIWIDMQSGNPLKMENLSLSNELVRTVYFPKWAKAKQGNKVVYYPTQVRIFRTADKAETILLVQETALSPLASGIFTKAWLESQSR